MTKRSSWWTRFSLIVAAALQLYSARVHAAAPLCSGENTLPNLIWLLRTLNAGTTYTIETANITGDPVMHLLISNPSGGADQQWTQVAANDDFSGRTARIVYTPTITTSYRILVRSFNALTTGVADIRINGSTILTQNPFGSQNFFANWIPGERVRVTPTRRTAGTDPMLFLLTSNLQVSRSNDDSGPNQYPVIDSNNFGNSSSRVIWGHYPGSITAFGRLTIEPQYVASGDQDGDLIMNTLEAACGLDAAKIDSDADTIPDTAELFGNNGFSMSLGSQFGNNPTRRNVYVEVDAMNSVQVTVPYATIGTDMATIFNTDGAIDIYVDSSTTAALPYSTNLAFSNCGTLPNCTLFNTLRTANFSTNQPERAPYFHYAVYGDRRVNDSVNPPVSTCNSGSAPMLGTNLMVTLGTGCLGGRNATNAEQRGTSMHELGHNLNLVHNRNDDPSRNYSTVHASVMNYRYQLPGVTGRLGALAHTYSFGTGGCADCATSPKQYCIALRTASPTNGCTIAPRCDCDLNEWGTYLTTDFINGRLNPNPGATPGTEPLGLATEATHGFMKDKDGKEVAPNVPKGQTVTIAATNADSKALLAEMSATEFAPARNALNDNLFGGKEGQLKTTGPDKWKGSVPDVVTPRRKQLVAREIEDLKARGLEQGKDFVVSADGTEVYQPSL